MALTKAHNRMIEGAAVNVKDFGAVGDGVTDDTAAIQAACDYLQQFCGAYANTPTQGTLYFPGNKGEIYATSGGITLPECKIIGDNTSIKPIGNPSYIFKLDLRHTTNTRRFTKNWYFGGFRLYTDRGFGVDTLTPDVDYFLFIDGGWLIRSTIENIDTDPGFACRSIIEWDLTHPDIGSGVTEVGVPDGIELKRISAQYAQNTSFAISITGDGLGTGSRIGSTQCIDIYNSITYPHDYTTRANATNDFGVIRVDTALLSRWKFDEIYGTQPIKMTGTNPVIQNSTFETVYVEFNSQKVNDFESILRSGTYKNCDFISLDMYTENTNLTASPRYFFATFERCNFYNLTSFVQSQITNPPDSNFINIGSNSFGCVFHKKPIITNQPNDPGLPWILQRMTVNADTRLAFLEPKIINQIGYTSIPSSGSYLLCTVPSNATEINTHLYVKCSVRGDSAVSATLQLRLAGGGVSSARTGTAVSATFSNDVSMELELLGRSDLIAAPSPTQFSTNSYFTTKEFYNGSATTMVRNDANIQYNSGDYEVYLDVSSKSGSTLDLGGVVAYLGYSREYVNIA